MNWYNKLKFSATIFKERDFLKKLKRMGCQYLRTNGSHQIWQCPGTQPFSVPIHGSGTINPSLSYKIIKRILNLNPQQFLTL